MKEDIKRMDNCANLAIVIPAYKIDYLDDCLVSIANQTNKNFKLYIGNDNSPHDIEAVVNRYRSRISLEYKKFSENLGSVSLVKHWERCIEMTEEEEWIWLFSDDDMMEDCAVESFFSLIPDSRNVYRFNLNIINNINCILKKVSYPTVESTLSFLQNRLQYKYDNAITNYIFSRNSYCRSIGFVEFPMAWASDDASIIQFCELGKLVLIDNCTISWRNAGENISSDFTDHILVAKIEARLAYIKWLYDVKKDMVMKIVNHQAIVSGWFCHALEIEASNVSVVRKFEIVSKLYPYLGKAVYIKLVRDLKSEYYNKIRVIFSRKSLNKIFFAKEKMNK